MSWTFVIWLMSAGVCITLAAVHLLVWLRDRNAQVSLAFSLWAMAVGISALFELALMHSPTPEKYAELLGATAFPFAVTTIAWITFVRLYLRAGRRWLMWSIFGFAALELLVRVTVLPTLPFVEIADLHQISLWGETLVAPVGVKSFWAWITGLLVMSELAFVGNAAVEAWRGGGRRRQVLIVAVAVCCSTAFSIAIAVLVMRTELHPPITFTLASMFTILVMAYGLSSDLINASQLSQNLRASQERMRLAVSAADLSMWEWDINRDIFWLNETSRERLGVGKSERLTFDRFLELLHPDDREPTRQVMRKTLEGEADIEWEYRKLTQDGANRLILARGGVEHSPNGKPLLLRGVSLDITKRKRAEEQLIEAEERYRTVANFTYDWEYWENLDGSLNYVSPSCERITGYTTRAFIDNPPLINEIIVPEDRDAWREHYLDSHQDLKPHEIQLRIQRRDGEIRWIEHNCQPVTDHQGHLKGFRASNRDITSRKLAEIELRKTYSEIELLKNQLEAETAYLQQEIKLEHNFETIIGNSTSLKYVLYRVEQVAATDTTVLILGESGTGKELIARAIHSFSQRSDRPLVKVNCATLMPTLVESELFGHERGAFTGAQALHKGRFEIADGSTLFLDEIGELPQEVQIKLLRVLQEGEFERLGSSRTIKVDVRIIAATNRDLEEEVNKGRFREDLFYRLNVYPVTVPPLRQRVEDIPLLVNFIVEKTSKRLGKSITQIPESLIQKLTEYSWPGNIRELENVIERAVINSSGPKLYLAESLNEPTRDQTKLSLKSLQDIEKEHILRVLTFTNWRIAGANGASRILDMHPSTLRSRMDKLGIQKP